MVDSALWFLTAILGVGGLVAWFFFPEDRLARIPALLCAVAGFLHSAAGYLFVALPVLLILLGSAMKSMGNETLAPRGPAGRWLCSAAAGLILLVWFGLALPASPRTLRFRSFDAPAPTSGWAELVHDFAHHPEAMVVGAFLLGLVLVSAIRFGKRALGGLTRA